MNKYGIENTVYIKANNHEEAMELFWEMLDKAGIGSVFQGDPTPNCFVSDVEMYKGNDDGNQTD